MKMYDRILSTPNQQKDISAVRQTMARLDDQTRRRVIIPGTHALAEAVVVDATNVAEFYFDHYRDTIPNEFEQLAPIIAPPFHATWWESRYLPRMFPGGRFKAWGALCQSFDLWERFAETTADERDRLCRETAQGIADQMYHHEGDDWVAQMDIYPEIVGDVRWVAYWWLYLDLGNRIVGPLIECRQFVQSDGNMATIKQSDKYAFLVEPVSLNLTDTDHRESISVLQSCAILLNPFFLATSFCHCKNIALRETPQVPDKVRRRREKKLGQPLARFTTLVIDPMRQTLQSEGGIERNGLRKALHICRGHFAHYSDDKPLFGKYSGTFWRPAHVRGSADIGLVGKDYAIKAPAETER